MGLCLKSFCALSTENLLTLIEIVKLEKPLETPHSDKGF